MEQRQAVIAICLIVFAGNVFAQGVDAAGPDGRRFGAPPARDARRHQPERGWQGAGTPGPEGGREEMMARIVTHPRMAQELGLTQEQLSEIQDSLDDVRAQGRELRVKMQASGEEQARLLTAEPFDEAALMQAIEKSGDLRTEIAKLRVRPMIVLRQVLTLEQIKTVTKRMQSHRRGFKAPGGAGVRRARKGRVRGEEADPRGREEEAPPRADDAAVQPAPDEVQAPE